MIEELADRADGFELTDGTVVTADEPAALQAAELFARVVDAVGAARFDPVAGAYADADIAALVAGPPPVADLAPRAVEAERTRMQDLTGRAPDLTTYLPTASVTPAALAAIPAQLVLLDASQIRSDPGLEDPPGHPPTRRRLSASPDDPEVMAALLADPALTELLADPPTGHGRAIVTQRVTAETAMLYLAAPATTRALLTLPPTGWTPVAGTTAALLDGLQAPWLTPTAPRGDDGAAPARLATSAASLPATVAGEIITTRNLIDALGRAIPVGVAADPRPVRLLDDALLRSTTAPLLADAGTRTIARLTEIEEVVEAGFGDVDIVEGPGITLTSDTGDIPVTIERSEGGPIEVEITVESTGRLLWDEGAQQEQITLGGGDLVTVSFTTQAVSRGTFPVTVSVWDVSHTRLLDAATLSVRSTAISRPALAAVAVVVVSLLAVGARRRRRPRLEVVP
jgi:hypothetical protein